MDTRFEPINQSSNRRSDVLEARERDSGLRLAELVAAFSLAMDLGLGQPMEHVLSVEDARSKTDANPNQPRGMSLKGRSRRFPTAQSASS